MQSISRTLQSNPGQKKSIGDIFRYLASDPAFYPSALANGRVMARIEFAVEFVTPTVVDFSAVMITRPYSVTDDGVSLVDSFDRSAAIATTAPAEDLDYVTAANTPDEDLRGIARIFNPLAKSLLENEVAGKTIYVNHLHQILLQSPAWMASEVTMERTFTICSMLSQYGLTALLDGYEQGHGKVFAEGGRGRLNDIMSSTRNAELLAIAQRHSQAIADHCAKWEKVSATFKP